MTVVNEQLNALSSAIWEWQKEGKPLDTAPEEIKQKIREYQKLYKQARKEELQLMGCDF